MNSALKRAARLVLQEAFFKEFSQLANSYMVASDGLGYTKAQAAGLADQANVFSITDPKCREDRVNIWIERPNLSTSYVGTLAEALGMKDAARVYLFDRWVFERVDGEWQHLNTKG
jgi:hypothetical protein